MVKVTAERIPDCQVRLSIEVEPERVEASVEKAYRRLVGRVNIPGFRRGKAPRRIVERFVGRDALLQDGLELLVNEVYTNAVQELHLSPIDQPSVDLEPKAADLKPGATLTITATVPVQPIVELGDYRAIRVTPIAVDITEREVSRMIDQLRERQAEWAPVERGIAEGDRVTMDVLGQVGTYARLYSVSGEPLLQSSGGKTITDEKATEFDVVKASPRYPPGFVDSLIGMAAGQEKQFELSLPPDYHDSELASKLAIYKVAVTTVREKHLPAEDDEFARTLGYETVEGMRSGLRVRAQARAEAEARAIFEDTVVREAVISSNVEVPSALVNEEVDSLVERAKESLKQQRTELDQYLRMVRKSEAELREDFRERAERNVRTAMVLSHIGEREGVQVAPEEVSREIEQGVLMAGRDGAKLRQSLETPEQRQVLERRIWQLKVVQLLCDIAVTPEPVPTEGPPEGEPAGEAPAEAAAGPSDEAELTGAELAASSDEAASETPSVIVPAAEAPADSVAPADGAAEVTVTETLGPSDEAAAPRADGGEAGATPEPAAEVGPESEPEPGAAATEAHRQ